MKVNRIALVAWVILGTLPNCSISKASTTLVVANPSFEINTFATWPGYCDNNRPITGWTLDNLNGGGINPAGGSAPFASKGPIPDGTQFAFIQAEGDILHQTVSGFTVGDAYYVHYYEGARAGYPSPGLEVRVGGATVLAAHTIPSGANWYFETFSDVFVATNVSLDLAFVKSDPVAGDTTALLDDVAVVHIAPGTRPFVTRNPQPLLVSVGDSATFQAQGIGSLPLAFQWLKNGAAVPGATKEVLTLNIIQKVGEADYSLRITNTSGSVTSAVAHLTVYEPIPDLYNTGVGSNRVGLADGVVDPHYQLIVNPGTNSHNAIVEDSTVSQFLGGTWLADTATSRWIGPRFNTSSSAGGDYVYRTVIDLTGRDPGTLVIEGQWASDNTGNDIQVNGYSTGNPKCLTMGSYTAFNIYGTDGLFVAGTNNINFLVNNGALGYTGLRVEIIRSNLRTPLGTPPQILTAPVGQTATVGDTITFAAVATGTPPLYYRWQHNGSNLTDGGRINGATTPTLIVTSVQLTDDGNYTVTVSNSWGLVTSAPVGLMVTQPSVLVATHATTPYLSPGTNTIVCAVSYPLGRKLYSLMWTAQLPAGWGLLAATGDGNPELSAGDIVFTGAALTNPLNFSYTISIPANQMGTNFIRGTVTYLLDGMVDTATAMATPDPLPVFRAPYHSADYQDPRWVIDSVEVSWVLAYWRAQALHLQANGRDGYAVSVGNTNGPRHSADYRAPYWVLDGSEMNRVLSYWRAGGYHPNPTGLDGYAPGKLGGGNIVVLKPMDLSPDITVTQAGPPVYVPGEIFLVTNTIQVTRGPWRHCSCVRGCQAVGHCNRYPAPEIRRL